MESIYRARMSHRISIRYTYFGYVWEDMQELCFRKQYLTHIMVFINEHKDLPHSTAKKFAKESFKILYAKQLFPVVAWFPLAYYSFEKSASRFNRAILYSSSQSELIAFKLYRIKEQISCQ